jgi:hypothetical protein
VKRLGEGGGHVVAFGDGEDVALAGGDDHGRLLSLRDVPGDPFFAAHAREVEVEQDQAGVGILLE